jgi:hypothetical protein
VILLKDGISEVLSLNTPYGECSAQPLAATQPANKKDAKQCLMIPPPRTAVRRRQSSRLKRWNKAVLRRAGQGKLPTQTGVDPSSQPLYNSSLYRVRRDAQKAFASRRVGMPDRIPVKYLVGVLQHVSLANPLKPRNELHSAHLLSNGRRFGDRFGLRPIEWAGGQLERAGDR